MGHTDQAGNTGWATQTRQATQGGPHRPGRQHRVGHTDQAGNTGWATQTRQATVRGARPAGSGAAVCAWRRPARRSGPRARHSHSRHPLPRQTRFTAAGTLRILTEYGRLDVEPTEIAVIGRGMRFSVHLLPPAGPAAPAAANVRACSPVSEPLAAALRGTPRRPSGLARCAFSRRSPAADPAAGPTQMQRARCDPARPCATLLDRVAAAGGAGCARLRARDLLRALSAP